MPSIKVRLIDPIIRQGVIVGKYPTYLKIMSEGVVYIGHQSANKLHYQIGCKVQFEEYSHEGAPCARITKVVSSRSEVTVLLHTLYEKIEDRFIIFDLQDIAEHGLKKFCLIKKVEYMGVISIGMKTRYLFKQL